MIHWKIVLDKDKQLFWLSLELTRCNYFPDGAKKANVVAKMQSSSAAASAGILGGLIEVALCLLSMEEDKVDNSGFPTFVKDENVLICNGIDYRVDTCIESSLRVVPHSSVSLLSDENKKEGLNVVSGSTGGGSSLALSTIQIMSMYQLSSCLLFPQIKYNSTT
jgi:hypothetical protein